VINAPIPTLPTEDAERMFDVLYCQSQDWTVVRQQQISRPQRAITGRRRATPVLRNSRRSQIAPRPPCLQRGRKNERTRIEGPLGELLRATGVMAAVNPFRFSTKFQDDETGLLYYGHRYYEPGTGRWNIIAATTPTETYDSLGQVTSQEVLERRGKIGCP